MTTRNAYTLFSPIASRVLARERPRPRDARAPAAARRRAALACVVLLVAAPALARPKPHAPHASSAPTTAQILAPSAATVPDALPVESQVYRCGNSYSSRPCDGGRQVDVADARTEAQRAQAADVAARDKRLAAWMEAQRHTREQVASPPARTTPASRPAPACKPTRSRACTPQSAASTQVYILPAPRKGSVK